MSLSLNIKETVDRYINAFISAVSTKYNLDINELQCLWDVDLQKQTKKTNDLKSFDQKPLKPQEIDPETLLKCNKEELIVLCKLHGHKCSGTKNVLMSRLIGKVVNEEPLKSTKKSVVPKNVESTSVVKKLTANIPNIIIRRNKYNNYEHSETCLIFDNSTKIVIGKQNSDGSVSDLTEADIDQCNAFKFKFKIPMNLDGKSTLADVDVDELNEYEKEDSDDDCVENTDDRLAVDEEELLDEDELLGDDDYEEAEDADEYSDE
jgi:hypothetical protein